MAKYRNFTIHLTEDGRRNPHAVKDAIADELEEEMVRSISTGTSSVTPDLDPASLQKADTVPVVYASLYVEQGFFKQQPTGNALKRMLEPVEDVASVSTRIGA